MMRSLLLWLAIPASSLFGADWPMTKTVEAQPLLAQVTRLQQALQSLGQPLPPEPSKAIESLRAKDGEMAVARVQEMLDPLCFAAIVIDEHGVSTVVPAKKPAELVEQGWRNQLIKVVNNAGATGQLRLDSPSARPVPKGPKAEVGNRWMSLQLFTGQPLLANLSGLKLEYTVAQIYSRDAGEKSAMISFHVEGGSGLKSGKGAVVREWKFAKDTDGWTADNNCKLTAEKGSLKVTMTNEDPYFSTKVAANKGKFILRFWAKFEKAGVGQVYWTTKNKPMADGGRQIHFNIDPGQAKQYEVPFDANDSDLTGVRVDPGNDPGTATFDWITLSYRGESVATAGTAPFTFVAQPSIPVTFKVSEFDGTPTMAAFVIKDREGRIYPAQAKRLAPDFFFHQQVYRATGETVRLPAGKYTVRCSRGPESIPELKELVVGDKPVELRYVVNRWIDPTKRGWYSGDHHIHAAGCAHYDNPTEGVEPEDMMRHVLGEDLKVGCCLTWGPCFDYQKRFFTGKPDNVSRPPYLLRYDVEVSGFGSHQSGHLNLLNLSEQIPAGGNSKHHWPTLGMNTLRWAKKQGGITGPAHSGNGLTRFVDRIEGAKDGPGGVPHFNIPAYDGIGANEFIVDVTHTVPGPDGKLVPAIDFISTMDTDRRAEWTMWYHVLNCGFRVRASGETDFPCISGDRVGMGRIYARVDGEITFEKWVKSLQSGRSYVSDGTTHLMDFTASANGVKYEVGVKDSEIKLAKPGKVSVSVQVAAWQTDRKTVPVELIVNGMAVEKRDVACDGKPVEVTFDAEIARSSWVAIRVLPSAHTNPFFVIVDNKPIRANRHSVEWAIAGVEQCWKMKANTYHKDERAQAEADYNHARKIYRQILQESPKE